MKLCEIVPTSAKSIRFKKHLEVETSYVIKIENDDFEMFQALKMTVISLLASFVF